MTTVRVYKATTRDTEKAREIIEAYCQELDIVVRDTPEQFISYFDSGVWLGEVDGQVAGCVVLRPLGEKRGEVKRLFVLPQFRKTGIAVKLMDYLEKDALDSYEWLYLDTKEDLVGAIRLYERLGYERCERYNNNPQATIFMRKKL